MSRRFNFAINFLAKNKFNYKLFFHCQFHFVAISSTSNSHYEFDKRNIACIYFLANPWENCQQFLWDRNKGKKQNINKRETEYKQRDSQGGRNKDLQWVKTREKLQHFYYINSSAPKCMALSKCSLSSVVESMHTALLQSISGFMKLYFKL